MSDIKAEWTNKDNLSVETTACDYIKREDAIRKICKDGVRLERQGTLELTMVEAKQRAVDLLSDIPAADVVEVVRCKDCKYWTGVECNERDIDVVDDDEYCSYGKRKGQAHE